MFKPRKRPKGWSFNRMIPNILTLLALAAGLTSIRYGLSGHWEKALVSIGVAAVLDALDGRIARLLKGTSKFGAELDSLSDFVCFGVAPAMILYLWTMQTMGRIGWAFSLVFAICCVLRLARFNTDLEEPEKPAWAFNFFTGVPAPAGAGIVLIPLMLYVQTNELFFAKPALVGAFMVATGALLVSKIPTFSFKQFKVPHSLVLPVLLGVGAFAAILFTEPWIALLVILTVYLGSLPFSVRSYARFQRREAEIKGDVVNLDKKEDGAS